MVVNSGGGESEAAIEIAAAIGRARLDVATQTSQLTQIGPRQEDIDQAKAALDQTRTTYDNLVDNIKITAELITPIAMEQGLRFAIREGGRTVASGVVSKIVK